MNITPKVRSNAAGEGLTGGGGIVLGTLLRNSAAPVVALACSLRSAWRSGVNMLAQARYAGILQQHPAAQRPATCVPVQAIVCGLLVAVLLSDFFCQNRRPAKTKTATYVVNVHVHDILKI